MLFISLSKIQDKLVQNVRDRRAQMNFTKRFGRKIWCTIIYP